VILVYKGPTTTAGNSGIFDNNFGGIKVVGEGFTPSFSTIPSSRRCGSRISCNIDGCYRLTLQKKKKKMMGLEKDEHRKKTAEERKLI